MLKAKALIPALLLSGLMLQPVSALPGKLTGATEATPMQIDVAGGDWDRDFRGGRDRFDDRGFRDRDDRHFRRGYAHREPPRGWHRFGHRPGDWRTRGCLEIGPAWFCP